MAMDMAADVDEEEFGFSRNYFLAKELGGSGKKSDCKLSDIDLVDEQVCPLLIFLKTSIPNSVFSLSINVFYFLYIFSHKKMHRRN